MRYRKDVKSQEIEKALYLEDSQVVRLKGAIQKAYDLAKCSRDFSIDEINSLVAPYIKTPEETFYVATVIVTDVIGAATQMNYFNRG